jgi:hypothetical protein
MQRYALTFSSCFDYPGSRPAGGHLPDARRPALPGEPVYGRQGVSNVIYIPLLMQLFIVALINVT